MTSQQSHNKPKPRGGTETILLVEDEPALRQVAQKILEQNGYTVIAAQSGPDAMRIWDDKNGRRVDLLLTDMVMPDGVSGGDLARELQSRDPELKVVFTTGYSAEFAGRDLTLREGQNFLQKPSTPHQILETVRHCLDNGSVTR